MSFNIGDFVETTNGARGTIANIQIKDGMFRYQVGGVDGEWFYFRELAEKLIQGSSVDSPPHYDLPGGVQVIDLIRDESFLRGNLIKYVFRAPHKGNELEDMRKAAKYLKWEIERLENEQS